ncbi:hypothetical protein PEC302107_04640 [Pectobacterium araliae]|nr:hypothetical protein PEC302107_04640 [Pectobacterium carotovorum subsp. carotovorum]
MDPTLTDAFRMSGDKVKGQSRLGQIMDYLKSHNLVSVNNVSPATIRRDVIKKGVTTPTEEKAGVKQDLGANASRRVLLADSRKYGAYSLFCVTPLSELTDIITDSGLVPDVQAQLKGKHSILRWWVADRSVL